MNRRDVVITLDLLAGVRAADLVHRFGVSRGRVYQIAQRTLRRAGLASRTPFNGYHVDLRRVDLRVAGCRLRALLDPDPEVFQLNSPGGFRRTDEMMRHNEEALWTRR